MGILASSSVGEKDPQKNDGESLSLSVWPVIVGTVLVSVDGMFSLSGCIRFPDPGDTSWVTPSQASAWLGLGLGRGPFPLGSLPTDSTTLPVGFSV